jgi:AraC-like DNA-binding protein
VSNRPPRRLGGVLRDELIVASLAGMTVGSDTPAQLRTPAARAPHPALRGLVEEYHGYHHAGLPAGTHHGLPSSTLTVIVAFDEPVDVAWADDPASRDRHWMMVSGLHTTPALIRHTGFQHGIQLALTPRGARQLLGLPAGALAGTLLSIDDPASYDELAGATTWGQRFDALDRLLLGRLAGGGQRPPERGELAHAWRRIQRSRGAVRIDALAAEVGWSRRHLTDRFTAEYGIGPKQAARIERFQRARLLLGDGLAPAGVAAACGYADQAHLTRDFRSLGGCTPTQWRREVLSFVQDGESAG